MRAPHSLALAGFLLAGCTQLGQDVVKAQAAVTAFQARASALCTTIQKDAAAAALVPVAGSLVTTYVTPYVGDACTAEALAGTVTEGTLALLGQVDANIMAAIDEAKKPAG